MGKFDAALAAYRARRAEEEAAKKAEAPAEAATEPVAEVVPTAPTQPTEPTAPSPGPKAKVKKPALAPVGMPTFSDYIPAEPDEHLASDLETFNERAKKAKVFSPGLVKEAAALGKRIEQDEARAAEELSNEKIAGEGLAELTKTFDAGVDEEIAALEKEVAAAKALASKESALIAMRADSADTRYHSLQDDLARLRVKRDAGFVVSDFGGKGSAEERREVVRQASRRSQADSVGSDADKPDVWQEKERVAQRAAEAAIPPHLSDIEDTKAQAFLKSDPLAGTVRTTILGSATSDTHASEEFYQKYRAEWHKAHGGEDFGRSAQERAQIAKDAKEAAKEALSGLKQHHLWPFPVELADEVENPTFGSIVGAYLTPRTARTRGGTTVTTEGPGMYTLNRLGGPAYVLASGLKTGLGGNEKALKQAAEGEQFKAFVTTLQDAASNRRSAIEVVLENPPTIRMWSESGTLADKIRLALVLALAAAMDVFTPDVVDASFTAATKTGLLKTSAQNATRAADKAVRRGASIRETVREFALAYQGDIEKLADAMEAGGDAAGATMLRDRMAGVVAQTDVGRVVQGATGRTPGKLSTGDTQEMTHVLDGERAVLDELAKDVGDAKRQLESFSSKMEGPDADAVRPARDAAQRALDESIRKMSQQRARTQRLEKAIQDPKFVEKYNKVSEEAQRAVLDSFNVPDTGAKAARPVSDVFERPPKTEPMTEPGVRAERDLGEAVPADVLRKAANADTILATVQALGNKAAPKTLKRVVSALVDSLRADAELAPVVAKVEDDLRKAGIAVTDIAVLKRVSGMRAERLDRAAARASRAKDSRQAELDAFLARALTSRAATAGDKDAAKAAKELRDALDEFAAARADQRATRTKGGGGPEPRANLDAGPDVRAGRIDPDDRPTIPSQPADVTDAGRPGMGELPKAGAGSERTGTAPRPPAPVVEPVVTKSVAIAFDPHVDEITKSEAHRDSGVAKSLEPLDPVREQNRRLRFGPARRLHFAAAGEPYLRADYVQRPPMKYAVRQRTHLFWLALRREHSKWLSAGKFYTGTETKEFAERFGLPWLETPLTDGEWFRVRARDIAGRVRNYHGVDKLGVQPELVDVVWTRRADLYWQHMDALAAKTPELERARAMNEYLRSLLWKSDPFADVADGGAVRLSDTVFVGDEAAAQAAGPLYQQVEILDDGARRVEFRKVVADGLSGRVVGLEKDGIWVQPYESVDGRHFRPAGEPVKVRTDALEYMERGRVRRTTARVGGRVFEHSRPMHKAEWAALREEEAGMAGALQHRYADQSRFLDLAPPKRPTVEDFDYNLSALPDKERKALEAEIQQAVPRGEPKPRLVESPDEPYQLDSTGRPTKARPIESLDPVDRPTEVEEGIVSVRERQASSDEGDRPTVPDEPRGMMNAAERAGARAGAAQRRAAHARAAALRHHDRLWEVPPDAGFDEALSRKVGALSEAQLAERRIAGLRASADRIGPKLDEALQREQASLSATADTVREAEINKATRATEAAEAEPAAHVSTGAEPAERIFKADIRSELARKGLSGMVGPVETLHDAMANAFVRMNPKRFPTRDSYFAEFVLKEGGVATADEMEGALLHTDDISEARGLRDQSEKAGRTVANNPAARQEGKAYGLEAALQVLEEADGDIAKAYEGVLKIRVDLARSGVKSPWASGVQEGVTEAMGALQSPKPQHRVAASWANAVVQAETAIGGPDRHQLWQGVAVMRFGDTADDVVKRLADFLGARKTHDFRPNADDMDAFRSLEGARQRAVEKATAKELAAKSAGFKLYAEVEPSEHALDAMHTSVSATRHKGGWTVDAAPVLTSRMSLEQVEDVLRFQPVEHVAVFDKAGRPVAVFGAESAIRAGKNPDETVFIDAAQTDALRRLGDAQDIVLTHAHPTSPVGIVVPFSAEDVAYAAMTNAAEMRVVAGTAPGWTLKRPVTGWTDDVVNRYAAVVQDARVESDEAVHRWLKCAISEFGFTNIQLAQQNLPHDIAVQLSRASHDVQIRRYAQALQEGVTKHVPEIQFAKIGEAPSVRRVVLDVVPEPAPVRTGVVPPSGVIRSGPERGSRPTSYARGLSAVQAHEREAVEDLFKSLGQEIRAGDTNAEMRLYPLHETFGKDRVTVDAAIEAWGDKLGWKYKVFGPDEAGNGFSPPMFGMYNYGNNHVWLYQLVDPRGSFRDYAYSLAWRFSHEVGHGRVEAEITTRYGGAGKRQGALGIPTTFRGKPVPALSLADTLRAVEWEFEAIAEQRALLAERGVHITDDVYQKEYALNTTDAVMRALSGSFTSPGDFGVVPTAVDTVLVNTKARNTLRAAALTMGLDMNEVLSGEMTAGRMAEAAADGKVWVKEQIALGRAEEVRELLGKIEQPSPWTDAVAGGLPASTGRRAGWTPSVVAGGRKGVLSPDVAHTEYLTATRAAQGRLVSATDAAEARKEAGGTVEAYRAEMETAQAKYREEVQPAADAYDAALAERPGLGLASGVRTPAPVFYSALDRAVEALRQEKFTAEQLRSVLKNTPGVKAEELEARRVEEFLQRNPRPTKVDLAAWLGGHKYEVSETVLDNTYQDALSAWKTEEGRLSDARDQAWNRFRQAGPEDREALQAEHLVARRAQDAHARAFELLSAENKPSPKYQGYASKGGKGYTETLIKHPRDRLFAEYDRTLAEMRAAWHATATGPEEIDDIDRALTKYAQGTGPGALAPESVRRLPETHAFNNARARFQRERRPPFASGHFGKSAKDLMAHNRGQEMPLASGGSSWHVEEFQSDLHQAGRERGYAASMAEVEAAEEVLWQAENAVRDAAKHPYGPPEWVSDARKAAQDELHRLEDSRAPGHPGKEIAHKKTWPELLAKRSIREAASRGLADITWTTGVTQVARYPEDTRQVVDKISWVRVGDNFEVEAFKDAELFSVHQEKYPVEGRELEEAFGRDVAAKMRASGSNGFVEGPDLTLGGAGMQAFYDDHMVQVFKKLGKKYGVVPDKTEILTRAGPMGVETNKNLTVWHMSIPKEMRDDALYQGFPLFHKGGATVKGLANFDGARAYLTFFESGNLTTILHEPSHAWLEMLPPELLRPLEEQYGVRGYWTDAQHEAFVEDVLAAIENPAEQLPKEVHDAMSSLGTTLRLVGEGLDRKPSAAAQDVLTRLMRESRPPPTPVATIPGRGPVAELGQEAAVIEEASRLKARSYAWAKVQDYGKSIGSWFRNAREVSEAPLRPALRRVGREMERSYEAFAGKLGDAVRARGPVDGAFPRDLLDDLDAALTAGIHPRLLESTALSFVDQNRVVLSAEETSRLKRVARSARGTVQERADALLAETAVILQGKRDTPKDALRLPYEGSVLFAYGVGTAATQHRGLKSAVGLGGVLSPEDAAFTTEWLAGSMRSDRGRAIVLAAFEDPFAYVPELGEVANLRRENISPFVPFDMAKTVERIEAVLDNPTVYVPRAISDKLMRQIEAVEKAAQPYSGRQILMRYWRQSWTMGVLSTRPRFFFNNAFDDLVAMASVGGFNTAFRTAGRNAAQNFLALPFVANAVAGSAKIAGVPQGEAMRHVSDLLSYGHGAHNVGAVMDLTDDAIELGGKTFVARELGLIAGRAGVGETYSVGQLRDNLSDIMRPRGPLGKFVQANADAVTDAAHLISARQRYGFFLSLVDQGVPPERAAEMTVDALYDYQHSLHQWERDYLTILHPFWAFEKNNARRVARAMMSPGVWVPYAARRIHQTHMAKKDATAILQAVFDTRDEYGFDRASLEEDDPAALAAFDAAVAAFAEDPNALKDMIRRGDVPDSLVPFVSEYWADDPVRAMLPTHLQDRYTVSMRLARTEATRLWLKRGAGRDEAPGDDMLTWSLPDDGNVQFFGLAASALAFAGGLARYAISEDPDPGALHRMGLAAGPVVGDPTSNPALAALALLSGLDVDKPDVELAPDVGRAILSIPRWGPKLVELVPDIDTAETADSGRVVGTRYRLRSEAAVWADILSIMPVVATTNTASFLTGSENVGKAPPAVRAGLDVANSLVGANVQNISPSKVETRIDTDTRRRLGSAAAEIPNSVLIKRPMTLYQSRRDARQLAEAHVPQGPPAADLRMRLTSRDLAAGDETVIRVLLVRAGVSAEKIDEMESGAVLRLADKVLQ